MKFTFATLIRGGAAGLFLAASVVAQPSAPPLTRGQWGAPLVKLTHTNRQWVIAGKRNQVILNETHLAMTVQNGTVRWSMVPSGPKDLLIKANKKFAWLSLANGKIRIVPYDTGFKTGVKITWGGDDLTLSLTPCLEGLDEELVCDVAADELAVSVRQLDRPPALDARGGLHAPYPEHPTSRSEAMRGQAEMLSWSRRNLGITAAGAGSDWVIPHVDIVNQPGSVGKCVPVPLYDLVCHDAVLIPCGAGISGGEKNLLLGILCGGVPESPVANDTSEETLTLIRKMAALNKRVALPEMTGHEFLGASRSKERTTFADGTTVTVDWNAKTAQIQPDLSER